MAGGNEWTPNECNSTHRALCRARHVVAFVGGVRNQRGCFTHSLRSCPPRPAAPLRPAPPRSACSAWAKPRPLPSHSGKPPSTSCAHALKAGTRESTSHKRGSPRASLSPSHSRPLARALAPALRPAAAVEKKVSSWQHGRVSFLPPVRTPLHFLPRPAGATVSEPTAGTMSRARRC